MEEVRRKEAESEGSQHCKEKNMADQWMHVKRSLRLKTKVLVTTPEGKELVWWRLIEAGLGFGFRLRACEAGKKGRKMFWPDGSEWEITSNKQWLTTVTQNTLHLLQRWENPHFALGKGNLEYSRLSSLRNTSMNTQKLALLGSQFLEHSSCGSLWARLADYWGICLLPFLENYIMDQTNFL